MISYPTYDACEAAPRRSGGDAAKLSREVWAWGRVWRKGMSVTIITSETARCGKHYEVLYKVVWNDVSDAPNLTFLRERDLEDI